MDELTSEERELLKWILQAVKSQYSVQPLENLTDICEAIGLGHEPAGLERTYYGMNYKHQLIFLTEYIKAMEK